MTDRTATGLRYGTVSFYHDQTKIFETQPMEAAKAMDNSLKTMPLRFTIGLNPLPPGEYVCQVTVIDPTGQKSAFWNAPITLVVDSHPVHSRTTLISLHPPQCFLQVLSINYLFIFAQRL